jgi:predicted SAM-dependent methyltransferase
MDGINEDIRVVIGAGVYNNNPEWIQTQESELNLLQRHQWLERFSPNTITAILAEHVWEHLDFDEGVKAANLCFEFLRPGGYVRCAVPDGYFLNEEYQRVVQIGGPGPVDHPAASHKIVHNFRSITSMFNSAGFKVSLLEYCDEEGNFHYSDWDQRKGFIFRSKRFDHRNIEGKLGFVSLIVDAEKPIND